MLLFRPKVTGLRHVPSTGPVIIASNHLSFSDSIFMPLVVPRKVTFLAKSEYFTSPGIKGFIKKNNIKTIYSLETEHASVIDVVKNLDIEKKFFKTNSNGTVNLKEIEELLSKQASSFLVSIMFANNESGIIHPITEISKIVKKYKGLIS